MSAGTREKFTTAELGHILLADLKLFWSQAQDIVNELNGPCGQP